MWEDEWLVVGWRWEEIAGTMPDRTRKSDELGVRPCAAFLVFHVASTARLAGEVFMVKDVDVGWRTAEQTPLAAT